MLRHDLLWGECITPRTREATPQHPSFGLDLPM